MEFLTIDQAKKQAKISYLGTVNQSAKLMKNFKVFNVLTYSLYLSPSHISGYEVCPESTPECRLGCLNTSGLAMVEVFANKTTIKDARITKTRLLFEHQEFFMNLLVVEINSAIRKANKIDALFSVRLNCTSDVDWANVLLKGRNIFEIFPEISFYDYTKIFKKFDNKPENYHLTYSYTGYNYSNCLRILESGNNIAIIFNLDKKENLPEYFDGFEIVDGDISDLRSNDKKGVIVGLKWKKIANRAHNEIIKHSHFVVQMNDKRINVK
jgi:hypothetical protein